MVKITYLNTNNYTKLKVRNRDIKDKYTLFKFKEDFKNNIKTIYIDSVYNSTYIFFNCKLCNRTLNKIVKFLKTGNY